MHKQFTGAYWSSWPGNKPPKQIKNNPYNLKTWHPAGSTSSTTTGLEMWDLHILFTPASCHFRVHWHICLLTNNIAHIKIQGQKLWITNPIMSVVSVSKLWDFTKAYLLKATAWWFCTRNINNNSNEQIEQMDMFYSVSEVQNEIKLECRMLSCIENW